jgi:polysaccharide export outer membrane protein
MYTKLTTVLFLLLNLCLMQTVFAQSANSGTSLNENGGIEEQAFNSAATDEDKGNDYALKIGDTIRIQVYGEEELSMDVRLNNLGSFDYPYLGELQVLGKTLDTVQAIIREGLMDGYLVNPRVSVSMDVFREVFVGGEVSRSGNFPYTPGLTVGKAVVLAGGFTERASKKRIKVISEDNNKRKEIRVGLDYILKPGDEINVPRRFF